MVLLTLVVAFVTGAFFVLMVKVFSNLDDEPRRGLPGSRSANPGENPLCYLD